MKITVKMGHTLLVDGSACINLLAGEVEVFGAPVEVGVKTVIRDGKRVAFEAKKNADFDLVLSDNASFEEFEGSTIPASWEKACNITLAFEEKPVIVVVMGEVDSGKTSFCTYLANMALRERRRVAIIDADLGQSDIGPPATIGFSRLTLPIKDLFLLKAENAYFIGTTSPSGAVNKVIDRLAKAKDEGLRKAVDFLIVNTDGWVLGEEAVQYKLRLIKRITPNVVIGLQQQNELTPILTALKGAKAVSIEFPKTIKKRDREKRKILRELSYKKYLKGAKMHSYPLSSMRIEDIPNLEEELGKKVKLIREGDEQGLLVGLHDETETFLGIGILDKINYERRILRIYTPVTTNISSIHVGQIRLDRQGKEIGLKSNLVDVKICAKDET